MTAILQAARSQMGHNQGRTERKKARARQDAGHAVCVHTCRRRFPLLAAARAALAAGCTTPIVCVVLLVALMRCGKLSSPPGASERGPRRQLSTMSTCSHTLVSTHHQHFLLLLYCCKRAACGPFIPNLQASVRSVTTAHLLPAALLGRCIQCWRLQPPALPAVRRWVVAGII